MARITIASLRTLQDAVRVYSILDHIRGEFVPSFCEIAFDLLKDKDRYKIPEADLQPILLSMEEAADGLPLRKRIRVKEITNKIRDTGELTLKQVKMLAINFGL